MITKTIGRAMAAQLDRVNESPERLKERLAEANQTIDNLREQLRKLKAENSDLRLKLRGEATDTTTITGEVFNGRPVLTIAAAAKLARFDYHKAYRRVSNEKWQAVQLPDRSWRVYADQSLN